MKNITHYIKLTIQSVSLQKGCYIYYEIATWDKGVFYFEAKKGRILVSSNRHANLLLTGEFLIPVNIIKNYGTSSL